MKKLCILLVLALILSACGKTRQVSGQVLEVWQDQLILGLDGGGRLVLQLPDKIPEPAVGSRLQVRFQGEKLLGYDLLEGPAPQPTEFCPQVPQVGP